MPSMLHMRLFSRTILTFSSSSFWPATMFCKILWRAILCTPVYEIESTRRSSLASGAASQLSLVDRNSSGFVL